MIVRGRQQSLPSWKNDSGVLSNGNDVLAKNPSPYGLTMTCEQVNDLFLKICVALVWEAINGEGTARRGVFRSKSLKGSEILHVYRPMGFVLVALKTEGDLGRVSVRRLIPSSQVVDESCRSWIPPLLRIVIYADAAGVTKNDLVNVLVCMYMPTHCVNPVMSYRSIHECFLQLLTDWRLINSH